MFKLILLIFFSLITYNSLAAQVTTKFQPSVKFNTTLKDGIELMYNLDYQPARKKFEQVVSIDSSSPAGYVYLALNDIFRLIIEGESPGLLDQIENEIKVANQPRIRKNGFNQWDKYFASNAHFLDAGWAGRQKKYLHSMQAVKRGMQELQVARTNAITRADSLALIGCYQYFIANTPWSIRFFSTLFIEANDRRQGLRNLEESREQSEFNQTTSAMILGIVYIWEGELELADMTISNLLRNYPNNALIYNLKKELLEEKKCFKEATALMQQCLKNAHQRNSGLFADINYDLGLLYLKQNDISRANHYFIQGYNSASNKPLIKANSALKLGMICEQNKKNSEARQWYRNAIALSEEEELVNACAKQCLRKGYAGQLVK